MKMFKILTVILLSIIAIIMSKIFGFEYVALLYLTTLLVEFWDTPYVIERRSNNERSE